MKFPLSLFDEKKAYLLPSDRKLLGDELAKLKRRAEEIERAIPRTISEEVDILSDCVEDFCWNVRLAELVSSYSVKGKEK